MTIKSWNTKNNYWKISAFVWCKQFRFGVWWDCDYDITEVIISVAFWQIEIWKHKQRGKK